KSKFMTDPEILNLYMLQSDNVRALWRVKTVLIKDINYQLRKSDDFQVGIKTKLLSLVYSAWSEAQFLQIVYTPKGFMYSEIVKIKEHKERHGISVAWRFLLEEAMKKVGDTSLNKDLKKRLQTLIQLIDKFIEEPSILRNKIAHGQWVHALNRENTAKNQDITNQLSSLDPVEIERRFEIHRYLGFIVRDLIQSPKAGFHRHYWTNIVNLEMYTQKTANWSATTRKIKLSVKPISYIK
ncbi:MAG: hypothetical protein BWK80_59580, partial [Desulfobacteraceae bacterium IS3]